jgi:excisionase family DNA binding protein
MPTKKQRKTKQRVRKGRAAPLKLAQLPPDLAGRVCVSPYEMRAATGLSLATIYRMMQSGQLRFVQLGGRMRKIPTSEYARLGLVAG